MSEMLSDTSVPSYIDGTATCSSVEHEGGWNAFRAELFGHPSQKVRELCWSAVPEKVMIRKRLRKCPVCGGKHDGYLYAPDQEQKNWGYPRQFRLCSTCQCPMVEVGNGHCKEFAIRSVR